MKHQSFPEGIVKVTVFFWSKFLNSLKLEQFCTKENHCYCLLFTRDIKLWLAWKAFFKVLFEFVVAEEVAHQNIVVYEGFSLKYPRWRFFNVGKSVETSSFRCAEPSSVRSVQPSFFRPVVPSFFVLQEAIHIAIHILLNHDLNHHNNKKD